MKDEQVYLPWESVHQLRMTIEKKEREEEMRK